MSNAQKLKQLATDMGYDDALEMLEDYAHDSVCPGICTETGCSTVEEVEPDCREGWCSRCNKGSIQSGLVLMGVI